MAEWIGCDGPDCPARALVHAYLRGDRELHYCGHHGDRYAVKLGQAATVIVDDRSNATAEHPITITVH